MLLTSSICIRGRHNSPHSQAGEWQLNAVLSVQGLCSFHKWHELRLGTTSLSPWLLSYFLSLTEVRLFILPQTSAGLGVLPRACGAMAMRVCTLLLQVYLCIPKPVYVHLWACIWNLHLCGWDRHHDIIDIIVLGAEKTFSVSLLPYFSPAVMLPVFSLRGPSDGQSGQWGSSCFLSLLPFCHPLHRLYGARAQTKHEKSWLPAPLLFSTQQCTLLSLSLPRCTPYPLYFHLSVPPSFPLLFFCFIICNMI